jgi:hypothetical protein
MDKGFGRVPQPIKHGLRNWKIMLLALRLRDSEEFMRKGI